MCARDGANEVNSCVLRLLLGYGTKQVLLFHSRYTYLSRTRRTTDSLNTQDQWPIITLNHGPVFAILVLLRL